MGAEVTVVEVLDRVLPVEDEEISAFARKSFEKQGIKIHTGATVTALERSGENVTARIEGGGQGAEITVERVILAVGIVGNVEDIGLENTGVTVERTPRRRRRMAAHRRARRLRDRRSRRPALAGAQGEPRRGDLRRAHRRGQRRASARSPQHPGLHLLPAAGRQRRADREGASEAGHEVKIGHFPFIGNGKAIALGEPEGMVKTVFDGKTGELLGAHMIGAEVTELIQGYTIAKTLETTETELIRTIFPASDPVGDDARGRA